VYELKSNFAIGGVTSAVVGTGVTAISGLFMTPFTRMGVDVVQKGAPFPWVIRVIPIGDRILWDMFVADLAIWVFIALVVSMIAILASARKRWAQLSILASS